MRMLVCLLLLTLSAWAREVVILEDGSRGIVLTQTAETALVGLTALKHGWAALDYPQAQEVAAAKLRSTHLQAEGMALLIDPKPPTNLRSAPNGPVLRKLNSHEALILLKRGDWHQVMTGDGATGYVHTSTVALLTLDCPKAQIDAICAPLAAQHKDFCSREPKSEGRKRMFLSITFGPLGRVVVNTKGKIVLRETNSESLSQGFSQDEQWLAIGSKLVNPAPPHSADYPADQLLYHKVNGSYKLVLDTPFYSLGQLRSKGVPDSVIRGLCLPYPKK